MTTTYDGIVIGSGHNSLILQAYLARAGLDVVCLETRAEAGGGLTTMEDPRHPGFFHNTHSFFHRAIRSKPWFSDLELSDHGVEYLEPELNAAMLTGEEPLMWWTDFEKTVASVERFSSTDAATLRVWRDRFRPIVSEILRPESQAPPLPPAERAALLAESELGQTLLSVSERSPLSFVTEEFEHPVVQAGLLFFNGLREVDLRVEGFGHHIPMLLATPGKAQMAKGGSAQLAEGLCRAVEAAGGEIRCNTTPERLLIENGRAVGVETTEGDRLRAREFVASGLNPHQTFLELTPQRAVPGAVKRKVEEFEYNVIAPLFGLYVNLDAPPAYEAAESLPALEDAFMVIQGLDAVEDYLEMVRSHEAGEVPPTIMWGATPTKFDPGQAPADKHTAFMWEKMPYHLHGDPAHWETFQEQHGAEMLDVWAANAPNLCEDLIDSFVRSPLDTERTFPNMRFGDLLVGSFDHGQMGYHRPFPGAGHYRAPGIDRLYLCGACCHPGGNITGLVGYNCAQVLTADLGVPAPWRPPPIEQQLEAVA